METMEELDDDFGDLYADVEAQVSSAINVVKKPKLFVEQKEDSITEKFNSSEGFAPHSKSCDSGETEASRKILGSEVNGEKEEVSLDNGSDSEDDLNIVLNYEGCQVLGVNGCVRIGGGDGENDSDDFVVTEGNGLHRNDKNGLEQSALKGSYYSQFSQYKYIRPHTGVFPSHAKGDGPVSVASISSMVSRGDCEDNEGNQYKRLSSSPVAQIHASAVPKSGYGFLLPRRRTILDVNIDTFELKPWRHPGADVTDFFNFGFDEQSWKDYCYSVHEQVQQQTSMLTRIPVRECFNSDQIFESGLEHLEMSHESMAVETAQAGQEGRDIPASEIASWGVRQIEMPKGRAIQVGGGIGERQSSMDVKRPRIQDSDVVIQITVQDTLENSSGSDKEGPNHKDSTLKEATQNGEFGRYDNRDPYSLDSTSGDGLSPVFPENSIRTLDSPSAMRRYPQLASSSDPLSYDNRQNSQISDIERHHHQDVHSSRGNSEEMVLSINTEEEVGRDKCSKDPCITEKESASGGRTQYSPSLSHFESPSEASEGSLYTDQEEIQKPSTRPSRKSVTELRESDTSHFNLLKDSGRNNVRHHKNYARSKSPIQGRHMHRSWRPHGAAELKMNNDDGACASFRPDEECLYDREYSPVSHSKRKERFHNFGSYHEEDVSYYRKTKISLGHHGERFGHDYFRDAAERRSDRKSPHRFRNELDPHMKKRWTERDDFLERRITRLDNEISERDWNYRERGGAIKHVGYPVCRKSRQMGSMPSFHSDKGKNTQWRKRTDGHYSMKRNEVSNPWLEHQHADDFMHKKYGRAVPFSDRGRESLDDRYEIPLPYTGSNMESFKRDTYGDRPTSDRHLRSMGVEDDCWRHVDSYQLSSESYRASHTIDSGRWHDIVSPRDDVYHLKSTGRCGRRRKDMYVENHGDGDWFDSYYNDAYYAGNDEFSPNNEFHFGRSRYNQQSQILQWTEDKLIARHQNDKLYDKEASFSHKRVSRHEYATLKSVHDEALIDDKQIKQHRCRMIREGSIRDFVCTKSKIIHSSKHERPVLRCRKSIDLFVVEGKSPGRCSKAKSVMCDGSLEKVNQDRDKEHEDIKQSQAETLVEPDIPNIGSNLGCEKWLDKYPVTECNEALDLEEGQILTDERDIEVPKEINKASESASVTGHMKRSISNKEIAAEGNKVVGGVDNRRILETLAKMEKRRERFKEPITIKKDSEKNPKPQVDPVVEIAESIQLRLARKRRWGGS